MATSAEPRLLDLFCGAGGAATGYARAGFRVVGVDVDPQPRYPFEFVQGDALDTLRLMLDHGPGDVQAIHASPPCQAYTALNRSWVKRGYEQPQHPRLIEPVRELLQAVGLPYVIENVPGAPLVDPVKLCGSSFGLGVRRHRLFELGGFHVLAPPCMHSNHSRRIRAYYGSGGPAVQAKNRRTPLMRGRTRFADADMGIDWMSWPELVEAIPPAYTELIGAYLLATVAREPASV